MNNFLLNGKSGGGGGGSQISHRPSTKPISVEIVYIAVPENPLVQSHAGHFALTYQQFNPECSHRLTVVCNGGELPSHIRKLFNGTGAEFVTRENDGGWDISAYIDMARRSDSELQVCLGESVYFHRAGWLKRIVECASQHGRGMYGLFSSHYPIPHLNTTAFVVSPDLLANSIPPQNHTGRYQFEHGTNPFWKNVHRQGEAVRLVTWDGCWPAGQWRMPQNILWRGDQSNCLVYSNHTDRYFGACPASKLLWSNNADRRAA